ncbi:MAG: RluA family pseudouridine synthase, partial [Paeniclostridium sordellii]|nr:RluA family pseudouridine synthase [Paeniclostridium sordellii]
MFKKEEQKYNIISYTSEENSTLKSILLDKLNFSVRSLSKMKREQSVLVNGKFKKPSVNIEKGDLIEVKINEEMANFIQQDLNLDIIYDDFDLIMVNKPPFMVVHPTKSHVDNTIANGVTDYITKKGEKVKIRFVNRLDMNTSGLVIVAKNAYAHHTLSTDMSNNKVEKKYITIVKGILENDFGTIDEPIYRPEGDSIKRIVDERGQRSVTHYKVLQRLNDATVLEVKLETGRTHQIRVHMNYIGHGIIGDELYGYV